MDSNLNLYVDYLEGKLCEKGLMKEHFDLEKNDLVRNLTNSGKLTVIELLKDPYWKKIYLLLAKESFKKYPLEIRKLAWKKVIAQININ